MFKYFNQKFNQKLKISSLDIKRMTMKQEKPRQITTKFVLFSFPPNPPYINKIYLFYKQKHHEKHIKVSFAILYVVSSLCERKRDVVWKNPLWELKFRATRWKFFVLCFFFYLRIKHKFIRWCFRVYAMASLKKF